jgi:hypothetical protein
MAACGRDASVPPVPSDLRRLEQREAGCIECHNGSRAPALDPDVIATPSGHPPLAIVRFLGSREGVNAIGR